MNVTQVMAMAKYEFLMLWRQRAIPVLMLSLAALPIWFGVFMRGELAKGEGFFAGLADPAAASYSESVTAAVQWFTWAAIYLILVIMAPLVMSALIPKDRQLGVRDLLDGLPLTPAAYLNGKLLGAWGTLFASLLVAMSLVILAWWWLLGTVHLPAVFSLWLVGGGAVLVLNAGLALLLAAGQPTRKRAYALAALLIFVTLAFYILTNIRLDNANMNDFAWWQYFTPDRGPLALYFLFENVGVLLDGLPGVPTVAARNAWQTILAGLAELALLWLLARRTVQTRR